MVHLYNQSIGRTHVNTSTRLWKLFVQSRVQKVRLKLLWQKQTKKEETQKVEPGSSFSRHGSIQQAAVLSIQIPASSHYW